MSEPTPPPAARGVCLVTGGGRGIGAATARLAAQYGYDVVVTYRSRSADADAVVASIRALGRRGVAVRGDAATESDVVAAFGAADALGPLRLLVNNAGIVGDVTRVADLDATMLGDVVRTNVIGAFLAAREAVRRMSTKRGGAGGVIVNVSSRASYYGSPNVWVHYAATKGALDTMTIGLAREVAGEGVRVACVRPGIVDTEIHAHRPPGQLEKMAASIPAGRLGTADEIAAAILWLASDAAVYAHGALLDVGGGL